MTKEQNCSKPGCCNNSVDRRELLKVLGLGTMAALSANLPAMAGPFEPSDFEKVVPTDKKLTKEWVHSLFARGTQAVYRGEELKYIGMPIGGLCSGQLYLGGDGKLWLWDIFNIPRATGGANYAKPLIPASPIDQGFSIKVDGTCRTLDKQGFREVSFRGEYPFGLIEYRDQSCPVGISLEAFSPFIPLNVTDSSLPATAMRFTLKNHGTALAKIEFGGWLENKVCLETEQSAIGFRKNRVIRDPDFLFMECSARPGDEKDPSSPRPAIVYANFEGNTFTPWKIEGDAFGQAPTKGAPDPVQKLKGYSGESLANSWAQKSDNPKGKLISPEFTIERNFINFLIAGGNHANETCINLILDDEIIRTATGKDTDELEWAGWNVSNLQSKTAHLEIIDTNTGGWGHIDIDQIEFSDVPRKSSQNLKDCPDFGTMGLALLQPSKDDQATAFFSGTIEEILQNNNNTDEMEKPFGEKITGGLVRKVTLAPGESHTISFVITWHFPNLVLPIASISGKEIQGKGRFYATQFESAKAVAIYLSKNHDRLYSQTKLWNETWYDSTLPYWFLDRTFANTSTLATSTAYRFADGRFYGWEGVGCCYGTCTHVWHYEQAMGRLFPEFDILLRDKVDYADGVGFNAETGGINNRAENSSPAIDGTSGTILRTYRDHQMSRDDIFLKRNWNHIKKTLEWLIRQDGNHDGILEGAQANTLDADWFGAIPWISGLYLAALQAGAAMALEAGDKAFAKQCQTIVKAGQKNFVPKMWNGEYFIQVPDPKQLDKVGSYNGCEIDQVFGQHWAFQTGLGRLLPKKETRQALKSIWKYNFTPDVGPYREKYKSGRWYAMAGEAGTLMCSWPKGEKMRVGKEYDFYFNECMNGFEHQVAGHMIWEDMVLEGLALERAIHDRYHAARRNPWNEVECGDHYARSMASYGVFTAACGYEYHGPNGYLGFAPRLTPENFKAAFTSAEGWGTFLQTVDDNKMKAEIHVKWGKLHVKTLGLRLPEHVHANMVKVLINGQPVIVTHQIHKDRINISLGMDTFLEQNQKMEVRII